jgi:hypothetical protein
MLKQPGVIHHNTEAYSCGKCAKVVSRVLASTKSNIITFTDSASMDHLMNNVLAKIERLTPPHTNPVVVSFNLTHRPRTSLSLDGPIWPSRNKP